MSGSKVKKSFSSLLCVAVATVVLPLIGAPAASANERPDSVASCKPAMAQGKTPATVRQPKVPARTFPKRLTLNTNCGDIVIALNRRAPQTITNISALANARYFDRTLCHRLTTEGLFVLQCGDPTATGGGSPTGWTGYADENLPRNAARNYPAGTVAMANSGKGTNGSQFFLVYADTQLGPDYTIWGRITKGLDLLKQISEVGAYEVRGNQAYYAPDGRPIQTVEIVRASAR